MSKGFTHESTHNESQEWYTPRYIFEALNYRFDLDPCSPGADIAPWIPADKHYTYHENGLMMPWSGRVWMNPPYGMDTQAWLNKLALHGDGIALVFARTDTAWFHRYVSLASGVVFIRGRIQFVKSVDAADYTNEKVKPSGGCGAASMFISYGGACCDIIRDSGLGMFFKQPEPNHD